MAKLNKIMPPRNTTIRGQDHLLAYITPAEAQMLMDNGGAGKAGPMGIPAFFDVGEGWGGYDSKEDRDGVSAAETADGKGDPDAGVAPAGSYNDDSAAYDYSGFYTETPNPITGFSDYAITNPNQDARDIVAVQEAIANAWKAPKRQTGIMAILGLNTPKVALDLLQAKAGQFMMPRISNALKDNLMNPVYGYNNRVTGVSDQYGNLIEGTDPLGTLQSTREAGGPGGEGAEMQNIKPVNPETGQCDEGYMFDEDLQACRLDTSYQAAASTVGGVMAQPSDAYARMGLLDVAPTGLPQFQQQYGVGFGTPSQFADANMAFRRQGAYRPEYFDRPYPTTGYTLLS
jgi:hypothetical protein